MSSSNSPGSITTYYRAALLIQLHVVFSPIHCKPSHSMLMLDQPSHKLDLVFVLSEKLVKHQVRMLNDLWYLGTRLFD